MDRLINKPVFRLCNDWVFKEVFSKVPNALASLISVTLDIDYSLLENNIQIERSELYKDKEDNKGITCDFVVRLEDSYKLNIEVNTTKYIRLEERNLLFVSRLFSNIIPKGTKYKDFVNYKVAQLNINRFGNYSGNIISRIMLTDLDTFKPVTPSLIIYNFDIVKCHNLYYNDINRENRINKLIRWGTILETDNTKDIALLIGDDLMSKEDKERFMEVVDNAKENYVNFTKEQLEQDYEFKMEGIRLLGVEQGIEQGITQGIEQKNNETVTNMLKENLDISLISKITNLTEEEILKIKKSL